MRFFKKISKWRWNVSRSGLIRINFSFSCVTEMAVHEHCAIGATGVHQSVHHNESAAVTIRPDTTRIRCKPHALNYGDQCFKLSLGSK